MIMKVEMGIWIGSEYKNIPIQKEVKFDGKRIFVDGELFSDVVDYNINRILVSD